MYSLSVKGEKIEKSWQSIQSIELTIKVVALKKYRVELYLVLTHVDKLEAGSFNHVASQC